MKKEIKNEQESTSKEKPKMRWTLTYLCFGLSIGVGLGSLMGNPSIGMCYGMAAGLLLGFAMDAAEKKRRAEEEKQ